MDPAFESVPHDRLPEAKRALYRPRRPERSPFYAVLNQFFDHFTREYEHRFERAFGPLRGLVPKTVERFLGCGLPEGGFARVRCDTCRAEYFVAFSCKQRGFCPSCSAKRADLWAEFVRERVIREVSHRHLVFALPKALRSAFRYRRSLLPKLALCAWNAVSAYIRAETDSTALHAAVVSIQTAGDFLNWHPHLHVLAPAGAFTVEGGFLPLPYFDVPTLRDLFQARVLALLLKEQMVSPELVERMRSWRHSGFHAFAGEEIPEVADAVRVGLYMVRGPAATSRLRLDPSNEPKLRYLAKGGGHDQGVGVDPVLHQDFDCLDWIARLTSHIPEKGAQLVHYYGAYSNAHRGKALRREAFSLPIPEEPSKEAPAPESDWTRARRRSWARLIRKVYEADPLLCRCGEKMRVVGFITQASVIRKILDHVGRRFEPLKLPGRSPPLLEEYAHDLFPDCAHDPFPDYGPQ